MRRVSLPHAAEIYRCVENELTDDVISPSCWSADVVVVNLFYTKNRSDFLFIPKIWNGKPKIGPTFCLYKKSEGYFCIYKNSVYFFCLFIKIRPIFFIQKVGTIFVYTKSRTDLFVDRQKNRTDFVVVDIQKNRTYFFLLTLKKIGLTFSSIYNIPNYHSKYNNNNRMNFIGCDKESNNYWYWRSIEIHSFIPNINHLNFCRSFQHIHSHCFCLLNTNTWL